LKLRPRTVVNIAFVAFMATLVGLLANIGLHLLADSSSTSDVERASTISNAYYQALDAATLADLHATRYLISPNQADRQQYDDALRDAFAASAVIDSLSDENSSTDHLLDQFEPQLLAAQKAFAAQERGANAAATLGDTSVTQEVQDGLRRHAAQSQAEASRLLGNYRQSQRNQLIFSLGAILLGLPLMIVLLLVIRHYERLHLTSEVQMRRLQHAALTDSLTGLGNHRAFQERLNTEVVGAQERDESLSLALMDIDRFKDVNDSEGHAKGDQILILLAKLLEKAGANAHIFRVGGDEFAVVMPGWDIEHAHGFMESLRILAAQGLGGKIGRAHV
jgi:GGDEF domain-containing protein/CHASE3 domain sensor protein